MYTKKRLASTFLLVSIIILTVVSTPVLLTLRRFYRNPGFVEAYVAVAWVSTLVFFATHSLHRPSTQWMVFATTNLLFLVAAHPWGSLYKKWTRHPTSTKAYTAKPMAVKSSTK